MTIRVVHWYSNFFAGGGVANCVLALANAEAAAGAHVTIVSHVAEDPLYGPMTPGRKVHASAWDSIRPIGLGGVQLHVMRRAASRALRAMKADVVHAHGEFNPDNWWVPRLWDCPVILSPQGAFHPAVRARNPWEKRLYISFARQALYRHVTRFHALSPAESADISTLLPKAQKYCVSQGPSPAVVALASLKNAESHIGPACLMFVGRIDVPTKGLDILLQAFALAQRDGLLQKPAVLRLVGPDWRGGKSVLNDLAQRLGIQHMVQVLEPVKPADVAQLIQGCDAYVQLSRNEGNPLSLSDALVLGKPTIVTDRVGTVSWEEIGEMRHVKIVEPSVDAAAHAIADTLNNLDDLQCAAKAARPRLLELLSWENAAQQHLEIYDDVCQKW